MSSHLINTVKEFAQVKESYDEQALMWDFHFGRAADDLNTVIKPKLHVEKGDRVLDLGFGNGDAIKYAFEHGAGFIMRFEASLEVTKLYLLPWLSSKCGPCSIRAKPHLNYFHGKAYYVAMSDMTNSEMVMAHIREVTNLNNVTHPSNSQVNEAAQQTSQAGQLSTPTMRFDRIFTLNAFSHVAHDNRVSWLDFVKRHVLRPGGTITITVSDPENSMQALEIVTGWVSTNQNKMRNVTRQWKRWVGTAEATRRARDYIRKMALNLGFELVSCDALPDMIKGGYDNWTDRIQTKAQQLAGSPSASREVLKEKRIEARDQLYKSLVEEFKGEYPAFAQSRLTNDGQLEVPQVKALVAEAGVLAVLRRPVFEE